MNITNELRKYVQDWRKTPNLMDNLDAGDVDGILADFERIADRIDKEHQKAIRELNNLADASMLLPVDADGVPIHVGDKVVDWDTPRLVVAVSEDSICLAGYESDSYYRMGVAKNYHHRKPTVKDLLREIVHKCQPTYSKDGSYTTGLTEEEFAEYASKLRLADDGEDE